MKELEPGILIFIRVYAVMILISVMVCLGVVFYELPVAFKQIIPILFIAVYVISLGLLCMLMLS